MNLVHRLYIRHIRPHLRTELKQQRFKLLWFVWGYRGLFTLPTFTVGQRFSLLRRFLRIDWNVPHAHHPNEIVAILGALATRTASAGEGMLEAGCYRGGSTAKFSVACKLLGYKLWVYDSFQGVEPLTAEDKRSSYDFSGEYAAAQEEVQQNVARFGEASVCSYFKGWFKDTVSQGMVPGPVRLAYIDCDLVRGTQEVLMGVMPRLVDDGVIFSQDYHLPPVRALLTSPSLWKQFERTVPEVERTGTNLARLTFPNWMAEPDASVRSTSPIRL